MLYTERLLLRQPTSNDLDFLFAIYGDPATNLSNPAGPLASLEKAREVLDRWLLHWRDNGFGPWTIAKKEEPEMIIGFGGLSLKMYGTVERLNLGYRFAVTAWGKGYATELCVEGLRYAFDELGHIAVYAVVRPENMASIKVLEKAGMISVETLDDVPGKPHSLVYCKENG